MLTLLLTKFKLMFYLQVPNGFYTHNSDALNRKWLWSAEGLTYVEEENLFWIIYKIIREIMNSFWERKCLLAL